ncbi:response regulator [Desulforhabdus amnigena]|jgi:two-component system chemotaxis response regulator CheY|uniref:Response regulator n=1 Tax=Desulforhabdus amnigena TaxID=40218 RepID=A0A9W6FS06_9BACT|nr:response regulator [Desulforhabdus amnigena]NLJ27646.1 response regulator [Deltaproteobacteria bacterium]GLI33544.1 response regulator [Desulforhabdus amnigena]
MSYNILIVDDSGSMRKIIKKILLVSGFDLGEWWEAENGQAALKILQDHWVDLVLSDLHMPVMNGLELLQALKKEKNWSDLPVVFITTESNENRLNELLALGARGYIRKPFRPETIHAHLSEIMGEPNAKGMAISDEGCDF